jgi:hypothetical protein
MLLEGFMCCLVPVSLLVNSASFALSVLHIVIISLVGLSCSMND